MNQTLITQKIQCPINCRRRGRAARAAESFQKLIGANRLMSLPNQFQYLSAQISETNPAFLAQDRRGVERIVDAFAVIMTGCSERIDGTAAGCTSTPA